MVTQPFSNRFNNLIDRIGTGIFRKYEQGNFFLTEIMPVVEVEQEYFDWTLYGQVGNMAPKVGPNGVPEIAQLAYDRKFALAEEYRQKVPIKDREFKSVARFRNVVVDAQNQLMENLGLRMEYEGLQTLLGNNPFNDLAAGGQPPAITGNNWSVEGTDIVKDLTFARRNILKRAQVFPDTLIIGPDDEAFVQNNPDFRQTQLGSDPFRDANLLEGKIGRIKGLDVYVMSTVADAFPNYPHTGEPNNQAPDRGTGRGQVVPLLEGKALVLKRGLDLGFYGMYEGFSSIMYRDEETRRFNIMSWMTFGNGIIRPNRIQEIDTTGA